jgi:hypothetical protein
MKTVFAIIGLIVVVGWAARACSPTTWADIRATCEEETGLPFVTCLCITNRLEEEGYSPSDVEGEDFDQDAMAVAISCL